MTEQPQPAHFKGKEALEHVAEAQAKGILSSTEIHGSEIPGHISAGADAAREVALLFLIIWLILSRVLPSNDLPFSLLIVFSLSWLFWKTGRSAWLAWFRLERMHRIVEQERWEIKHHRKQEREELKELYKTKGFEGQLLEDVCDVLMADDDRLLRVMVEEELCLSLSSYEHPLKQAAGAAIGTFISALLCLLSLYFIPLWGLWSICFFIIAVAAGISAYYEGNRLIPAIVWNLGLAACTTGTIYFLLEFVHSNSNPS